MAKQRECIVCGQMFEYCPHCNNTDRKTTWKTLYCSENCRDIFNTCSKYEGKSLSQEEAYNLLIGLNINSKEIKKSVKGSVEKIMAFTPKSTDKIIDDEPIVTEPMCEIPSIENNEEEQRLFKRSRRRRAKKEFEE